MPSHASIVISTCDSPSNILLVNNASPTDTYERKFTVCTGPLSKKEIDMHDIVLWFELNKLLGAEKFYLYTTPASANMQAVLGYYKDRGLVDIIDWTSPMITGNEADGDTKLVGPDSALTECVLRNKRSSEFVVVIGINEHILTRGVNINSWTDIINRMKLSMSVYCFGHGYGVNGPLKNVAKKPSKTTCNAKSRYFVRTSDAITVYPHMVPGLSSHHVPARVAILYESCDYSTSPEKRTVDGEGAHALPENYRLEARLTQRVQRVLNELFNGVI